MTGNHLLVEIPCKPGDTVWCIYENNVYEAVAVRVTVSVYPGDKKKVQIEAEFEITDPYYDDGRKIKQGMYGQYGENVFLTKSEANWVLVVTEAKANQDEKEAEEDWPYFL